MRLVHYSTEPLVTIRATIQQTRPVDKPRGLWVSDEATDWGWSHWNQAEEFIDTDAQHATEIVLADDARLVVISTVAELDAFSAFRGTHRAGEALFEIRWADVAAEAQGIVISPYWWERRTERESAWYYGWDCASGCIWDPDAIAGLRPYEAPLVAEVAS